MFTHTHTHTHTLTHTCTCTHTCTHAHTHTVYFPPSPPTLPPLPHSLPPTLPLLLHPTRSLSVHTMQEHSHSPHGWREVEIFTVSPSDSSLRSISETLLQAGLAARAKRKEKATQLKIPSLPLPKPKDSMEVTMSSCVSPSDFYVQLVSPVMQVEVVV